MFIRDRPAGPGGAKGIIVFDSEKAISYAEKNVPVILVREETSPEDVDGMHASKAILTTKGGMTSHAALVARGWGKCCIVGCNDIEINTLSNTCLLYTSPSPRDRTRSRMPSSA